MSKALLVFDLGGVLVDVEFPRFAHAGLDRDPDADLDELLAACASPAKADLDRGRISPREFLAQLPTRAKADSLFPLWSGIFAARPAAAAAALARLTSYETWMLSDTDPAHFLRVLNDHPYLRGFDRYLLSYDRGLIKGDEGSFDPLIAKLNDGWTVRFWDDRPELVDAARSHGIDARLFTTWDEWEGVA